MKIKQKIKSSFRAFFITSFIVATIIYGVISVSSLYKETVKLIQTASLFKTDFLITYLNGQKEVISTLQANVAFSDLLEMSSTTSKKDIALLTQKANIQFAKNISLNPNINELFLIDKNGVIVLSTNPQRMGKNVSNDTFFSEGKKSVHIKDVYFSDVMHDLAWGISGPITNNEGVFLGVIVARLRTDPFFNLVKSQFKLGDTAETFIVNKDHLPLTPSRYISEELILKKKLESQNISDCFKNTNRAFREPWIFKDYRGVYVLGTSAYVPETQWCVITKVDALEIGTPIFISFLFSIGIIFGITIVFSYVSNSISKKITDPIDLLNRGVQEIKKGNLDYELAINSDDEIGELSNEFETLVTALKNSQASIDRKVKEQTTEIIQQSQNLQDQKKAILNILEDVESQKSNSEKLAKDLEKFQLAVENTNDHIVITDPDGIIVYVNKAAEKITGFSISEIIGKKVGSSELWGGQMPRQFYDELWQTIKVDKKPFVGEIKNKRKNGEIYIAKASIFPIIKRDNQVEFFVGIERDVTKEIEIDKMKTEFISLASHQLRTPLSATRWFAEMLIEGDMGDLSDKQKEAVASISASNKRMIDLVNSLLNISRIESGRLIVDPKPTDITPLINDIIKNVEKKLQEKKQKVILSIQPNLPLIPLDEKLIFEVYSNLLTNSIKYSPENTQIHISISQKDGNLLSQVSDSGYGIPKNQLNKIFNKFFRAENIIKKVTDGTGLGLYLVKSIIDSSEGKIWLESEEDKGTTFWFTLPMTGMKPHMGEVKLT